MSHKTVNHLTLVEPIVDVEKTKSVRVKNSFLTPHCILADGTKLSIQYHDGCYISNRTEDRGAPYPIKEDKLIDVEIGFPSVVIKEILEYAEDVSRPTETVYSRVPVNVVNKLIKKRGGIVQFESYSPIVLTNVCDLCFLVG